MKSFFVIDNQRIALSTIKHYGISEQEREAVIKRKSKCTIPILRSLIQVEQKYEDEIIYRSNPQDYDSFWKLEQLLWENSNYEKISINSKYFFILTFSGENYIFYEEDYDINNLLKRMDSLFKTL